MTIDLSELESKRIELLKELASLGDFRAGSVTAMTRRCGKASCHCARRGDPGHGPTLRLTYKQGGKTVSESLPDRAAIKKVRAEIAEFRRFQELCRALIDINGKICQSRSVSAKEEGGGSKKNDRSGSNRKYGRK